ncbi:MAG: NAD(+)/NADH kinase, partial [Candidatus Thermoplasmatota archaeon]|nr:NAD(+)/NADH kinase [Candidatus Thermoplasmatota archaeon]
MTNVLVVYKKNFESIHDESLAQLEAILEEMKTTHQLRVELRARERVRRADFIGRDLVVVLGGDGTLTSISHNIDESTPVMGVNSHPVSLDANGSVGFYMDSTLETFAEDFSAALRGEAIENNLPRLRAIIDSTSGNRYTTDPAMNELLIANTHQYAPSKYHLRRGEKNTKQQSSGLIFSTWLGQGAWFAHSLDTATLDEIRSEIVEGQEESHYFVLARDLNHGQRVDERWSWVDWTDEPTQILSDMHRGYVVPDGWDEVHFNRGASITV